ncbi:hypothetical protein ACNO7T_15745 [Vibrio campbellii]
MGAYDNQTLRGLQRTQLEDIGLNRELLLELEKQLKQHRLNYDDFINVALFNMLKEDRELLYRLTKVSRHYKKGVSK